MRHRHCAPPVAIASVATVFVVFALAVAILTPAWEAADEPAHVLNVETLVRGHWYRIEGNAGLEPHQPPLYYLVLAGWQRSSWLGHETRTPWASVSVIL